MLSLLLTLALAPPTWQASGGDDRCKVFMRVREGSDLKEAKAIGVLEADAATLHGLLTDLDRWTGFFPFIEESKVVERGEGYLIAYQRSSMPLLSDRDYVVRIDEKIGKNRAGHRVFTSQWTKAKRGIGPAPDDDIIRIQRVEGHWKLEELGPKKTKVTYYVFTDPGGAIPSMMVNMANRQALPRVFDAIEEEAQRRARSEKSSAKR